MVNIVIDDACQRAIICFGMKLTPVAGRAAASVRMSRLAAWALASSLVVAPAFAGEYTTFQNVEIAFAAAPDCRSGALLNLPAACQAGDGAVVLLTSGPLHDGARDPLVAAFLFEKVAVLERVLAPCDATPEKNDGIASGMLRAMAAVSETCGRAMADGTSLAASRHSVSSRQ